MKDWTPSGTPLCVMGASPTKSATIKNISIKSIGGKNHLNITMYKDSWNIPKGLKPKVTIDFLDNQPLEVDSYGDGKILDVEIPTQVTATFLSLLMDSKFLRISFLSGKEKPWVASLSGAKPKLPSFLKCMSSQEHSQPF